MKQRKYHWIGIGLVALSALVLALNGCDIGETVSNEMSKKEGSETETPEQLAPGITRFLIADTEAELSGPGRITAYVPYSTGFDPAALTVTVEQEEGDVVLNYIKDPLNFTKPKKISVRTKEGEIFDYTVTVYALFDGADSLSGLYAYTGQRTPAEEKPLYIALSGFDLSATTSTLKNPDGSTPSVPYPIMVIMGTPSFDRNAAIPGYMNGHYTVLDLSRCEGEIIRCSQMPYISAWIEGPFSKVTAITFPPDLRETGLSIFASNLTLRAIELPEGLREISYACFGGDTNLASVKLPSTLKTIGGYAFSYTAKLETLDLPEGLTSIKTFALPTNITRITLPSTMTECGYDLSNHSNLEYVDLSKTSFDKPPSQLKANPKLKEVYLPASLLKMSPHDYDSYLSYLFESCSKLERLVVYANTPPVMAAEPNSAGPYTGLHTNFKIYVPEGSVAAYQAVAGWSQYADKILSITDLPQGTP